MLRSAPTLVVVLALTGCAAPVEFVARDASGAKRSEGTLVGSRQEGPWTHYWQNGNRKAEGRYERDVQVGPWTFWHENGQKRAEGSFRDEHSTGRWRYWHPNGEPHMSGFFHGGRKTGMWSVFDTSGKLVEIGQYHDGKRTSRWTFYPGDRKVEGWFHRDKMVGPWRFEDATGQVERAQHELPTGVEIVVESWADGSMRRAGFVEKGVPTGRWVSWHDGETVRLASDLVAGRASGSCCAFDPRGELIACGSVASGRPTGTWQVRQDTALVEKEIDTRGRPPAVWSGVWSKPDDFDPTNAMVEVERWLLELTSPRDAEKILEPPAVRNAAATLPAAIVEQIRTKPEPPAPDFFLTQREIRELSRWVSAYTKELAIGVFSSYEPSPKRKDKSASRRLTGTLLPVAEFRAPSGETVDVRSRDEDRWTLLVLLRGFAGQVCPYCPMQMRALAPFRDRLEKLGVRVIALYPGPESGLEGFRAAYEDTFGAGQKPPYEILFDVDSKLPRALDLLDASVGSTVLARPATFVLDHEGRVRYAYVGRHRADRPAAENLLRKIRDLRR